MNRDLEKPQLSLGFIPLTDCAPLVVAQEMGFFAEHGLRVQLSKETSWANIRDKLAIGVLDGAQLLAPMAVASQLGLGPLDRPVVTALSLDLNGKAITVSEALYRRLQAEDPAAAGDPLAAARALKAVIEADRATGRPPLSFATVFPYSSHHYLLRYWMAAGGIDPDRDLRLIVIPPPQMVSQLERGAIDGYCVGEPWNSLAVRAGLGRVLACDDRIWNNSPEKVLGVNEEWAEQYPRTHLALVRALLEALRWLDEPANRPEAVELIAQARYLDAPADVIRMAMLGTFQYARNEFPRTSPDFHVFHRYAANFPWRSQALWQLTQMLRWGQVPAPLDLQAVASRTYRPEIYRRAAADLGIGSPARDYKTEGGHAAPWVLTGGAGESIPMGADRFFDGRRFDPGAPLAYLQGFEISHPGVDLAALARLNPRWTREQQAELLAVEPPPPAVGL